MIFMVPLHLNSSGALDPCFSCGTPDHYVTMQAPYLHLLQKWVLLWEKSPNFLGAIEGYSLHLEGAYAHD